MTRLALLVTARNAAAVIGRLFDSVSAQTTPFDEILVYDDGSTDATGEIARRRGARVVRGELTAGPLAGRNLLASETACDWIHFHDVEDALDPEFVARARTWMECDEVDVVLFATDDRDHRAGESPAIHTWDDRALGADPVNYAIRHAIGTCGIYRRRQFLEAGGFNLHPSVKYNEDQAMHLQLALGGLRFRSDTLPGVIVYPHAASLASAHPVECARAQVEVLAAAAAQATSGHVGAIGEQLWRLAGVCAGYSDWTYVERALSVCARLGYTDPREEHWTMRLIAQVDPMSAVVVRERVKRALKPALRVRTARGSGAGARFPAGMGGAPAR